MSTTATPTEDTKDIRLEIRLSTAINEKLNYCCDTLGLSKGEIIRRGIEKMHDHAEQKQASKTANLTIEQARYKRGSKIYGAVYRAAYEREYSKEYVKLILDPDILPGHAHEDASCLADEIAKQEAQDAVNDFWDSY